MHAAPSSSVWQRGRREGVYSREMGGGGAPGKMDGQAGSSGMDGDWEWGRKLLCQPVPYTAWVLPCLPAQDGEGGAWKTEEGGRGFCA
ncbi:hypothetical protein O3M35_002293 [Rhynocoris fuscipes]|uniref:Uncharacterized protein n=1 Tax=Rhynocoris fuscipes TaxID=488301 RepID=A0AAW1CNV9_9HEMI